MGNILKTSVVILAIVAIVTRFHSWEQRRYKKAYLEGADRGVKITIDTFQKMCLEAALNTDSVYRVGLAGSVDTVTVLLSSKHLIGLCEMENKK